ncbi:hypothetical protein EV178_002979 [Coemansia sp. RSA 1646]|nr:hypothetical protein EV178_002979 [Coemansia sp. RSA 1646]KAJ2090862.1 hypothetical protein IW138_002265 [Coemansia sp. RSA 986]
MAGMLLESGLVLVPLACAAMYIIVTSNKLLTAFIVVSSIVGLLAMRLRYHYSSGARIDITVRPGSEHQKSSDTATSSSKRPKPKKNKAGKTAPAPDSNSNGFEEIVQDARKHGDIDDEIVERSGALLSDTVTAESTKYDTELYGSSLTFDHRCFYINGRPTWIAAADFDYWRIPAHSEPADTPRGAGVSDDAVRGVWRRVLLQYKAAGFTTVRIRFHWGFHSPSKGTYDFSGSRNVNDLLVLCEELGILVVACIGPYIGDDVQGGGYPFWLVQRDHIRLRHLWSSGIKIWDDRFAAAQGEWYDQIISMLVGHEVVIKNARGHGCIFLVQLENHLASRSPSGIPLALHDETRLLARMARERIIRVPLATNNLCWPNDFTSLASKAWAAAEKKLCGYRLIKEPYRADVSGFHASDIDGTPVDIDSVARMTKGDNVPMAALELCGDPGTRSSRSVRDQIESALCQGLSVFSIPGFFTLADWGNLSSSSSTAANNNPSAAVNEDGSFSDDSRVSRMVLHMARAFELQSASSDAADSRPWISHAKRPTVRSVKVAALPKGAVRVRRQWEHNSAAESTTTDANGTEHATLITYVDGRSLDANARKELGFMFSLADTPISNKKSSFALTGTLGPRNRGIFVSNVSVGGSTTGDKLHLVAASKEIYTRISLGRDHSEVWVCAEEGVQSGQLFFHGECQVSGHAELEVVDIEHAKDQKFSFVIPKPGSGMIQVTSKDNVSVHIVLVDQQALDTLAVGYSSYKTKTHSRPASGAHVAAAWGVDGILFDPVSGNVELPLSSSSAGKQLVVVSPNRPQTMLELAEVTNGACYADSFGASPFIWRYSLPSSKCKDSETTTVEPVGKDAPAIFTVQKLGRRRTDWNSLPWKLLPTLSDLETMDQINIMSWQRDLGTFAYQATDIGFNASHVLYRCQVQLKPQHIKARQILLQLNVRHRCTVWINGTNMSGHETFHLSNRQADLGSAVIGALKQPGSSNGPDRWGGTVTYDVTKSILLSEADAEEGALNEVVVLVESFGVGTQANGLNDAHTPRGLIAAYWHGFNLIGEDHDDSEIHDHAHDSRTEQLKIKWEISGIDATQLAQPFNSSGVPDESEQKGWVLAVEKPLVQNEWSTLVDVDVDAGVQWLRWQISELAGAKLHKDEPIYLHVVGRAAIFVWVNGLLLGKHRASANESFILLSGGSLAKSRSASLPQSATDNVMVMMYGWADDADISGSTASSQRSISVELSLTSTKHTTTASS